MLNKWNIFDNLAENCLFFANAYLLKFEIHLVLYVDPRLYVQYLEEKIGMTP
jgi:hypothetical protein